MVDKSQAIIINIVPQQAVDNEPVNKSEMCIGWNSTMKQFDVVTGDNLKFS